MRVYHFLEAQHAISNIALRRIKISRFSDLNDPYELLGANLRNKNLRPAFVKTKEEIHKNRGLICFSQKWENPVLWSHYADKHRGICLGFEIPENISEPVNYTPEPLKIFNESKITGGGISQDFMRRLLLTKFKDWAYEYERRIFVNLDHKTIESGMYFYSFSETFKLKEVILGPRCQIPMKEIRALVAGYSSGVEVVKSRMAFGSFSVIKSASQTKRKT